MKSQTIRKILKVEYSRLVTLPLFWIALSGLEAGDLVEMSLGKNQELIVKPKKVRKNG